MVPGSHTQRVLPFTEAQRNPDNLLASGLEIAVEVDESRATDVVLAAGEMSLHHVDIVHGSNANSSAVPRVGFAVRYLAPRVSQTLTHHEVLLARGRDVHGHYRILAAPPPPASRRGSPPSGSSRANGASSA